MSVENNYKNNIFIFLMHVALDMQDFGSLSSRTVTEVLMLEMKMAPAAGAYLVSGYPRSMRDLAEYTDKVISTIHFDIKHRF